MIAHVISSSGQMRVLRSAATTSNAAFVVNTLVNSDTAAYLSRLVSGLCRGVDVQPRLLRLDGAAWCPWRWRAMQCDAADGTRTNLALL